VSCYAKPCKQGKGSAEELPDQRRRGNPPEHRFPAKLLDRLPLHADVDGEKSFTFHVAPKGKSGGCDIAFSLHCGDIAGKCDFVIEGETEEDVLEKFKEHIKTIHGIYGLSIGIINEFMKCIREENPA
jgi:predicted small metal-binding protein